MLQETLLDVDSVRFHYQQKNTGHFFPKLFKKTKKPACGPGVDEISFSIQRGEILGFLGENGAGKSTIINLITGNLIPHQGQVVIKDSDLFEEPVKARNFLGYLPDKPPLYPDMTVNEYLYFCGQLHGLAEHYLHLSLVKTKHQCGLTDHGNHLISQLSKGFQQRVGIAQAILHEPELIILDEPTNGLDPIQIHEIHQLIKELGQQYCVLLSSHNLTEIQQLCNKVKVVHKGRLIYQGDIDAFNQLANTQVLRIACKNLQDISSIEKLDLVQRVEKINTEEYLVHCDSSIEQLATRLVDLASELDWKMYQLSIQKKSLEWVFKQIAYVDHIKDEG